MLSNFAKYGFNATRSHSSLFKPSTLSRGRRNFSTPQFKENPIIFNKINEQYVIKGKERLIGWWLMGVSASVFAIIILGGYTRLTRSGLSMVKWHPHRVGLPKNQEEWEKEFEEYKGFPEYYLINKQKGMDVEGFKQIYFIEWAHRIVARSIGAIFMGPLAYFWYRGYFQPKMKRSMLFLFAFGGLQGFVGWWMVKSGLVDKEKTKELDKTPTVSPYRLTFHAYNGYIIYGVLFWLGLHLLRRPQEAVITMKNMADHNAYRGLVGKFAHGLLPIVLLTGFFTAGTQGRHAVNTFPKVGDKWFINKNHLNWDIPFWKNFTENKLVVQVTHRTLAVLFGLLAFRSLVDFNKLQNLSPIAKKSFYFLLAAISL